jgi:hypothetical protein
MRAARRWSSSVPQGGVWLPLPMVSGAKGVLELSSRSQNEHLVRALRLLLGDHGTADRHDGGDDAVDPLGRLVLGGLRLPAGSWATAKLAAIQRVTELPP